MKSIYIEQIQDEDIKVIAPMLKRLGISYTQRTLKEDDDPVLMAEAERVKNDKPASKKENADFQKWLKEQEVKI